MDEVLREFVNESFENVARLGLQLRELERHPTEAEALAGAFRTAHTIKGTCGFLRLPRLEALAHAVEDVLGRVRAAETAISPEIVGVLLQGVDRIAYVLERLEATGAEPPGSDAALLAALNHASRAPRSGADAATNPSAAALRHLRRIAPRRGDPAGRAQLRPIGTTWRRLPRLIRDLGRDLDKTIELTLEGADTEVDRRVLALINDPLTHIVRNAADHGIESPSTRQAAGKPPHGTITVRARPEGHRVVVEIADDGRGVDAHLIGRKAVAAGRVAAGALARLAPHEVIQFLFAPGVSTAEVVTNLSGRGVGLDVVRTNVEQSGGEVVLYSAPGAGTRLVLTLPSRLGARTPATAGGWP